MLLEESVVLACPPETVIAFLEAMEENYGAWHPDHVAFRWIATRRGPRDRFFFEERIGQFTLRATIKLRRSDDGRVALMMPTNGALRLVFPWMSFLVDPAPEGSRLVHRIALNLGPLRWLLKGRLLRPLRQHMAEEAANLRRLIATPPA